MYKITISKEGEETTVIEAESYIMAAMKNVGKNKANTNTNVGNVNRDDILFLMNSMVEDLIENLPKEDNK